MSDDPDAAIRRAAFEALQRLVHENAGRVPWSRIAGGFLFGGDRILFAGRASGIFKPKQMSSALSVRTSIPRKGRQSWYRDQESVADVQTGLWRYDLAHKSPASNDALRRAFELRAPLIYFRATKPSVYEAIWPVWVAQVVESDNRVLLAAADPTDERVSSVRVAAPAADPGVRERSYSEVEARRRNHQAWFSSQTKSAYGYRCAFSGLPLSRLLVGAHIVPDAEGGPASVSNGICMSTLHHTAFDTHLLGVDPDRRIHVAQSVFEGQDGPLLEGLKDLDGGSLRIPAEARLQPKVEYLERRYARFLEAQR